MEKEIKKYLASMNVKEDRENSEQKAYEIYKLGTQALDVILEYGQELKKRDLDARTKNLIRAVIFTLSVFYSKDKSVFAGSKHSSEAVDLLIEFFFLGFMSAKSVLSDMGFSAYDIFRKRLLSLPQVEKHRHDKEVSAQEAYEEIKLSRNYAAPKGFSEDRYLLGRDGKHAYAIYRIDEKLFAVRTTKK